MRKVIKTIVKCACTNCCARWESEGLPPTHCPRCGSTTVGDSGSIRREVTEE